MYILLFSFIGLFLLYLILICPNRSRRDRIMNYSDTVFAHRGYHNNRNSIPENSMSAFEAAITNNFPIELDVHHTSDQKVVVFHDDTLKRICGVDGIIEDMTFDELEHLSLLNTDSKIPLFEDVLKLINGRVLLLIELKLPRNDISICVTVYNLLINYSGDYMIQSFNSMGLYWFKKNAPEVLRGQLSSNLTKHNSAEPYILRLMVRFLLTNIFCKPDFISYKLDDVNNYSLYLNQFFYKIPVAVWTIRSKEAFQYSKEHFDMVIFERFDS